MEDLVRKAQSLVAACQPGQGVAFNRKRRTLCFEFVALHCNKLPPLG